MPDAITRVSDLSEKLIANSEFVKSQMKLVIRNLQDILVNPEEEGLINGDVK